MIVDVEALDRDEGTIVVFRGRDQETGLPVMFAADHRYAQAIADALPVETVVVEIEGWQVIG